MSDGFFATEQAGDPVFAEHLVWFVEHPGFWFTLLVWALCIAGAFKLGRLIKSRHGATWFSAYLVVIISLLAGYVMVLKSAFEVFVRGAVFTNDLMLLSWMSAALNVLAIGSAVWIIADLLIRKRG